MDTEEEIRQLVAHRPPHPPRPFMNRMDREKHGLGAVLHVLMDVGKPMTAGALSERVGVTTARMAVLLRQLEERGLIERGSDKKDARKTLISISKKGCAAVEEHRAKLDGMLSDVIREVGPERFKLFVELSEEVYAAMERQLRKDPELSEEEVP